MEGFEYIAQNLWISVYIAAIQQGDINRVALSKANSALSDYKSTFGEAK